MSLSKQEVINNLDEAKKYIEEIESEKLKEKKEVGIEIKNRWTGDIIFKSTKTIWKDAVEEAIKSKADLSWADLSEADLSKANLSKADLSKADLSWADLSKANLSKANLSKADLSKADLSKANLSKADLSEADLSKADLSEAKIDGCLFYMGYGNRNFEALCKAIKTLRHNDGTFDELSK